MDLFLDLKEKLCVNEKDYEDMKQELIEIRKTIVEEKIVFEEQFEIGFYSHMISLITRIKNNEKIDKVSEAVLDELDDKVLEIAKKVVTPLFNKAGIRLDISEMILVATHIQIAYNRMGGE